MFIIFGTTGVTLSKERGHFVCPACASTEPYTWKRVRRFFTLFFIPVIPLDLIGEYIECQRCQGTYREEVLSYDPKAEEAAVLAQFQHAVKRVMVLLMMADGQIEDSEIEAIQSIYTQISASQLSKTDIQEEIKRAKNEGMETVEYLRKFAPSLNDTGKELVINAAIMVAAADGVIQEEEKVLLGTFADALEMSPSHLRGLLGGIANPTELDGDQQSF